MKTHVIRLLNILIVCVFIAGCGNQSTTPTDSKPVNKDFKHKDFTFTYSSFWNFVPTESSEERFTFKSNDNSSKITISLMYYDNNSEKRKIYETFNQYVNIRRQSESDFKSAHRLSGVKTTESDTHIHAKFGGSNNSKNYHTETHITAKNGKIITLFVEIFNTTNKTLSTLSNEAYSNIEIK